MVPEASLDISRRQFLAAGGLTVAAACFAPSYLMAETEGIVVGAFKEAATAKVTVQNLRRNISVLLGPGGNIAVLTGPDGKLLVDAEIITARPHVTEALASINADPIKQLINTHWHFDHTGGNEWVHEAGANILAHENTRKHLSQATRVEGNFRYTFPAAPAEADILHTGDTFWNRDYPFIDYWTGGSIDGQIRAAEANIAKVTDKTMVIPGHGAVGNKADLVLFRDVLVEIRDEVAALKKQGKSLPEVVAAKPGARYDAVWGNLFQNPSDFVALVYQGV